LNSLTILSKYTTRTEQQQWLRNDNTSIAFF
jgi:hypothetical protein